MARLIKVDEYPDKVEVAGQVLTRPLHISPSEWLRFWEQVRARVAGAY